MDGMYCAYLRKSRADEVRESLEDGYDALAHHRGAIADVASRMGVEVSRWYSDGIKSGEKIEGRDGMQELLSDVRSGMWDGVIVTEVERLTRGDLIDQGTVLMAFADTSTLIITPMKVYDPSSEADMEYFEFGMFMSRREFKTINKRLIAGRAASVREGQFIAKDAPYGYDKARVDGMKTLVPNGDAKHVRAVFEMFADGVSYREIAKRLDLMGAVPMRGAKWSPNSVRNMVSNPVYIGKVRWNETKQEVYYESGRRRYRTVRNPDSMLCDGLHEAIVPDGLWERAKRRRDAAPVRKGYKQKNHYGRILVCAECGKALHYVDSGNAKEPMLVHLRKGEGCKTKGCRVSVMDAAVSSVLSAIIGQLERRADEGAPDRSEAIGSYLAEAERCERVVVENLDRMERGVLTEEEYLSRKSELEERAREARKAAEELSLQTSEWAERRRMTFQEVCDVLKDPDAPTEKKRLLVWGIIDRIEYQNRAPVGKDDIHLDVYIGLKPNQPARFHVHFQPDATARP